MKTCKYCDKEYDPKEVARTLGDLSAPYVLGYCSAQCYTKSIINDSFSTTSKPLTNMVKWIDKMFKHAEEREWFETYWLLDIHGCISLPDYHFSLNDKKIEYYPYAKEVLKLMTERKDIVMILYTSSHPAEVEAYLKQFENDGIHFKYVNENPEISEIKGNFGYYHEKPYCNVLFDDKAGFDPYTDWKAIYDYMNTTEYRPNPSWTFKTDESYHIKENK